MELSDALTCLSCSHVRATNDKRPYCALHKGPCVRRCPQFQYEPGSDEIISKEGCNR